MKEMRNLTGADIICECLIEQGVDTVFGYPGGAVLNIYDSLYNYSDKIHHVLRAQAMRLTATHVLQAGRALL